MVDSSGELIGINSMVDIPPPPTLPPEEYNTLLALVGPVLSLRKYMNRAIPLNNTEVENTCTAFRSATPVLTKALKTWEQGKENFYRRNSPHAIPTHILEVLTELRARGTPGLDEDISLALRLLEDHAPSLEDILNRDKDVFIRNGSYAPAEALKALSLIAEYSSNIDKVQSAKSCIQRIFPSMVSQIEPLPRGTYSLDDYMHPLLIALESGESQADIHQLLKKILLSKSGGQFINFFNRYYNDTRAYAPKYESVLQNVLHDVFKEYQVDTSWILSQSQLPEFATDEEMTKVYRYREVAVPKALRNLQVLHEVDPTIARTIQDKFGLENFHWYPPDILIRQYNDRDKIDKPYGVVLLPKIDRENMTSASIPALADLANSLDGKGYVRFIEADDKTGPDGLTHRFQQLNENYYQNGAGHKISFGVVVAHSSLVTRGTVHFGKKSNSDSYLQASDLQGAPTQEISSLLVQNPSLVLASCKVRSIFTDDVRRIFGSDLQASDDLINCIQSIKVNTTEDRIDLQAQLVPIDEQ